MEKIGFIGLGIMGKPMAKNLLRKGTALMVNDVNQKVVDELVKENAVAATLEEIGKSCRIIFTILPNGPIVDAVLFGEKGLSQYLEKGTLVCDLSSVSPSEAMAFGKKLHDTGVSFIDSPVSGGEPKAIDGTLSFMAGGSQDDFDRLLPYFHQMGTNAVLTGKVGSGCITKLTNQVIVNLNIAALSEGLVLAAKAGADPSKVYEAIRGGAAGSVMLDAKAPMIMDRDFQPGGKISINLKDIRNVIHTANELDIPVPFTSQLFEVMKSLKIAGQMDEDHASIVKYFERLAGIEVHRISKD